MEDRRSDGESRGNFGDGTDQRVEILDVYDYELPCLTTDMKFALILFLPTSLAIPHRVIGFELLFNVYWRRASTAARQHSNCQNCANYVMNADVDWTECVIQDVVLLGAFANFGESRLSDIVWIRKTNWMSLFVFFITLLIVAQHVSCNHVPIIRS